jgi:hypothetical protein
MAMLIESAAPLPARKSIANGIEVLSPNPAMHAP